MQGFRKHDDKAVGFVWRVERCQMVLMREMV